MSDLGKAQKMLAQAKADELWAKQMLEKSRRDRARAEKMIAQARPVTQELRRHRESNHFTDTFIQLFGGSP